MDLTELGDKADEAAIEDLCRRARTPYGPVAAICTWSRFVPLAGRLLAGTGIKVATVANFPAGTATPERAAEDVRAAFALGADEVDVVFPYGALKAGDGAAGARLVGLCRQAVPRGKRLKVILETGELGTDDLVRQAARIALDGGAHFIKTSTGKVPVNATPEAVRIMLEQIKARGGRAGIKPSGGIRTAADAALHLGLADSIMGPRWAKANTFRLGASGVLGDLLRVAAGAAGAANSAGPGY
ncbi:MAG: deoxyribose-phosphate aldolase [Hyphomicrobiaceae bacterium]